MKYFEFIIWIFGVIIILNECRAIPESFSMALIADAHYTGRLDYYNRLEAAVQYINSIEIKENIQIVGVLGDTAFKSSLYIEQAKEVLDRLNMSYFPILGDDPIQDGEEKAYNDIYKSHFDKLSKKLRGWIKSAIPTKDPGNPTKLMYLQNYAFDWNGVRIICTDWNTRYLSQTFKGERAYLYDFPGGTWPFFTQQIKHAHATSPITNNILLISHHPLHVSPAYPHMRHPLGSFTTHKFKKLISFTYKYKSNIAINFAGHYHLPWRQYVMEGGYEIIAVSSLHPPSKLFPWIFNQPRIMIVKASKGTEGFRYRQIMHIVPMNI